MGSSLKELLAKQLALRPTMGERLGIGTGSTVAEALKAIGHRLSQEGFSVEVVTTSLESSRMCSSLGFTVLEGLSASTQLDWGFDGADLVDRTGRCVKGLGGALLREKILAESCGEMIILVEEHKLRDSLERVECLVPVEVVPQALELVSKRLEKLNPVSVTLRKARTGFYGPVMTEAGNLILDVLFSGLEPEIESTLKLITGVVESGVFTRQASEIWVAKESGEVEIIEVR